MGLVNRLQTNIVSVDRTFIKIKKEYAIIIANENSRLVKVQNAEIRVKINNGR